MRMRAQSWVVWSSAAVLCASCVYPAFHTDDSSASGGVAGGSGGGGKGGNGGQSGAGGAPSLGGSNPGAGGGQRGVEAAGQSGAVSGGEGGEAQGGATSNGGAASGGTIAKGGAASGGTIAKGGGAASGGKASGGGGKASGGAASGGKASGSGGKASGGATGTAGASCMTLKIALEPLRQAATACDDSDGKLHCVASTTDVCGCQIWLDKAASSPASADFLDALGEYKTKCGADIVCALAVCPKSTSATCRNNVCAGDTAMLGGAI